MNRWTLFLQFEENYKFCIGMTYNKKIYRQKIRSHEVVFVNFLVFLVSSKRSDFILPKKILFHSSLAL